ncbi:MAG: hypothetical protein J6A04_03100 [Clostridia bacterium]|nr:hypothetical protein [Clostridia bacterium]
MEMYKKVRDMNFREYNDRFALVKNTGIDFMECDVDIVEPFYSYMYIHKNLGMLMVILGNEENEEKYIHEDLLINAEYGFFENFEIELIEDEEYEYADTVRWIYKQDCVSNENVLKTRNIDKLDKFRTKENPDMLNCQLLNKEGKTRQVYAKIKDYIEENDIMLVEIFENTDEINEKINDSIEDFIKKNDVNIQERTENIDNLLLAKHIKFKNFETIIVLEK